MKTINYKGKGEHSVNELELIIEQQAEELHLLKSGQKQLPIHSVVVAKRTLCYCGGNERIALDCTMKPCKHPKYFKG
jgi:hypothetical protein